MSAASAGESAGRRISDRSIEVSSCAQGAHFEVLPRSRSLVVCGRLYPVSQRRRVGRLAWRVRSPVWTLSYISVVRHATFDVDSLGVSEITTANTKKLLWSLRFGSAQMSAAAADRKARDMLYDDFGKAGVAAWAKFTRERAAVVDRYRVRRSNNPATSHHDAGRGARRRERRKAQAEWEAALSDPEVRRKVIARSAEVGIIETGIIEAFGQSTP